MQAGTLNSRGVLGAAGLLPLGNEHGKLVIGVVLWLLVRGSEGGAFADKMGTY